MRIRVCIATFLRPEGLARLLRALDVLTFERETPALEIVVVDNDSTGSAAATCKELGQQIRWPIHYCIEPQRGIPHVRNRALDRAVSDTDFIAFIDDDEAPEPDWLDELLVVLRSHHADVVTGPVFPVFEDSVAGWIVRGRFFESPRYPTGHRLPVAFTNNVLMRVEVLREMKTFFDPRWGLTGGDDTHFFRRIAQAGFKIVWADAARVHEWIPKSRACFTWLVQRLFRAGNTLGLVLIDLGSPWRTRLMLALKAIVWIGIGPVVALFGLVAGRHWFVKGIRFIAFGAGYLASIVGTHYEEYKTTHGS